jgi:hypothetical protein
LVQVRLEVPEGEQKGLSMVLAQEEARELE